MKSPMDKEKQRTTPQASMKSKSSLRRTQKKANTCRLIYGFNAPPEVMACLTKIKKRFKQIIYGKTIVKTQRVVMNRNTIEAMTTLTTIQKMRRT